MPKTTTIQSKTFCRAIEAVHRCASKDESRPHLNSISLWVDGQGVKSASTNGQMVAVYNEEHSSAIKVNPKSHYLLNLEDTLDAARVVKKFGKQLKYVPGGPTISLKHNKRQKRVVLTTERYEALIGIRTVDEDFPPIEKVIPKTGREPKFKHNFVSLKAELVTKALQCFTAVGRGGDFQAWDFGTERDPICVFKRYVDYSATLMVVIMPARVDAEDGRAGK